MSNSEQFRRGSAGGTVMDQEMDINKDVDEDDTEVQVQPNTSGLMKLRMRPLRKNLRNGLREMTLSY
ncbi:1334_t:CDS:2 [Rhizophagus irregularis]|nr:1334_t:CDS:2 [Rhizophagus irregularis]